MRLLLIVLYTLCLFLKITTHLIPEIVPNQVNVCGSQHISKGKWFFILLVWEKCPSNLIFTSFSSKNVFIMQRWFQYSNFFLALFCGLLQLDGVHHDYHRKVLSNPPKNVSKGHLIQSKLLSESYHKIYIAWEIGFSRAVIFIFRSGLTAAAIRNCNPLCSSQKQCQVCK